MNALILAPRAMARATVLTSAMPYSALALSTAVTTKPLPVVGVT